VTPEDEARIAVARESLEVYASMTSRTKQGSPLTATEQFHRDLVDVLERIERGKILRQLFLCPPEHGKSTWCSMRFPEWCLGRNPTRRIMSVSSTDKAPTTWSETVRNTLRTPAYQAIFPGVVPIPFGVKQNRQLIWSVAQAAGQPDPTYQAYGAVGAISGFHTDIMIVDDIVDYENSLTAYRREQIIDLFHNKLLDRVSRGGAVLVIGHRWNLYDLYGKLIDEGWPVLLRQALTVVDGEERALCPSLWSVADLHVKRNDVKKSTFDAKYQADPSEMTRGGMFKREDFKTYKPEQLPHISRTIQYWDTATKTKQRNDYSVCGTGGRAANGIYILDWWRDKLEGASLHDKVKSLEGLKRPNAVFMPNNTDSAHLFDFLKKKTAVAIREADPGRDKCNDAEPASALVRNGHIFVPEGAPWLDEFFKELELFPNGQHDDQVDVLAGLVNELRFVVEDKAKPRHGDPLVTGVYHEDDRRPRRRVAGGINPMARRSISAITTPRISW